MNKVIIFHGTDCSPDSLFYWYKWLQNELASQGFDVEAPHYPEINHESIETFLPKVLRNHVFDEDTVLVGHSSGAALILGILEELSAPVRMSILVAGYVESIQGGVLDPIQKSNYDWEKIGSNSQDFLFVNSANDPWGCDDKQGRILFDKLGGTQVIRNDGHFGSASKNLPYVRFPLVRNAITETKYE